MLSSLIPLIISVRVFSPFDPSDPIVVSAQSYLDSALPFLFPDAHGVPEIVLADDGAFVASMLTLSIKMLPDVRFRVRLTVTADGRHELESLTGLTSSRNSAGYHWQDPATLTKAEMEFLQSILEKQERFTGWIATVLAYRVQIVSGTKQHFIFKDDRGRLCAAVLSKSREIGERITYFANPPIE
jgi:hypothetical protein